jgi:hypothetical protein
MVVQLLEAHLQDRFVLSRYGNGRGSESCEQIGQYIETCQYDFFVDGVPDPIQESSQQSLTDGMSHGCRTGLDERPESDGVHVPEFRFGGIEDLIGERIGNFENLFLLYGGQ